MPFWNAMLFFAVFTVLAAPAAAGIRDTAYCKRDIAASYASLDESAGMIKSAGNKKGEQSCLAYRRHFIDIVKARAAAAECMTGTDRTNDLGRLDGAVEQINAGIAEYCG